MLPRKAVVFEPGHRAGVPESKFSRVLRRRQGGDAVRSRRVSLSLSLSRWGTLCDRAREGGFFLSSAVGKESGAFEPPLGVHIWRRTFDAFEPPLGVHIWSVFVYRLECFASHNLLLALIDGVVVAYDTATLRATAHVRDAKGALATASRDSKWPNRDLQKGSALAETQSLFFCSTVQVWSSRARARARARAL